MELHTERLAIRPLVEGDWPEMREIFLDFNRSPYVRYDRPLPTGDEESKALVRQFMDGGYFFTVRTLEEGQMVGYVCFHREGEDYDLGYCFHSAHQRKGYARESVTALLSFMAQTYPVARFTAGTALDNTPSCEFLKKLGFTLVSTQQVCFDGSFSFQGGNFERKP